MYSIVTAGVSIKGHFDSLLTRPACIFIDVAIWGTRSFRGWKCGRPPHMPGQFLGGKFSEPVSVGQRYHEPKIRREVLSCAHAREALGLIGRPPPMSMQNGPTLMLETVVSFSFGHSSTTRHRMSTLAP